MRSTKSHEVIRKERFLVSLGVNSWIVFSFLCSFGVLSTAQNPQPNLSERAYQDREILYELQAPESHAFRITHDYTVRKVGEKYYFNVVRAGSHVTDPDSVDLDTGEKLKWEIINGKRPSASFPSARQSKMTARSW